MHGSRNDLNWFSTNLIEFFLPLFMSAIPQR